MADISQMTLPDGSVVNIKDSAGREAAITGLAGKVDIDQGIENQGKILKVSGEGTLELVTIGEGSGDVMGPESSVDDHIATFDGATGKIIQDSGFTIGTSVPANAVFTDTTYENKAASEGGTDVSLVTTGEKATWNSKADLVDGKVPTSQLPSYVDDVLEFADVDHFPSIGETGKIYIAQDTNKTYRWSGTGYAEISPSLALGETSSTAYRGDRGKTAYDHATAKGSAFSSGMYKITTNSEGHVTAATAIQKSDITGLGIPGEHQDISGKKDVQTAVSDPAASGTSATFIATISQDAQGVITPTKKTVRTMGAASAAANGTTGLVPAPGSGKQTYFLRGDATWVVPTNTTYANFTKATSAAAGAAGLVPAPGSGKQASFLRGDATWAVPTNTTYAAATESSSGLMSTGSQTFAGTKNFTGVINARYGMGDVDITKSNNGLSSDIVALSIRGADSNGLAVSSLATTVFSDGRVRASLVSRNKQSDGTDVYNYLSAYSYKDGTTGYSVTNSSAFRTAIGVTNLAAATASANGTGGLVPAPGSGKQTYFLRGDATWAVPTNTTYANASVDNAGLMSTGDQSFAGTKTFTGYVYSKAGTSNLDITEANNGLSSDLNTLNYRVLDNDGYYASAYGSYSTADGIVGAEIRARNVKTDGTTNVYNILRVMVNKTGSATYSVSSPANFRSAIGIANMTGATSSANGAAGYVPAPGSGKQTYFLRGDATWAVPTNTTYADFTAATSAAAGAHGLVPAPGSGKQASFLRGDKTWAVPTDTKNTAGSTNSSSKLYLIGATSQAANPQTYSQDTAYVGTDGCLYSGGTKVLTAHQDISGKKNTQTAVSDPSADGTSATFIATISQNAQGVITPTKKTVRTMSAATASANGTTGLVPAPGSGKQDSFLRGDATWAVPTNTTYGNASTSAAGLMSTGTQSFAGNKTFTGAITSNYLTANADITKSNNGISEDTGTTQVRVVDSSGSTVGALAVSIYKNGNTRASLISRNKKSDGTDVWNYLSAYSYKDGTTGYTVSSPSAFRSAISAKVTQDDVADPAASGTSATFIATITQNEQGVITPTKKTVRTMSAASAAANGTTGLVPAPGSGKQTYFLRGDATWAVPTNTTYADFTAATSAAAGTHGLVPAPGSGKQTAFLRGDKTWVALGAAASKGVIDATSKTDVSSYSSNTNLITARTLYNCLAYTPSDWDDCKSINSSYSPSAKSTIQFTSKNGIAFVNINEFRGKLTTASAGSFQVAEIPTKYKPNTTIHVQLVGTNDNEAYHMTLLSSGTIVLKMSSTSSSYTTDYLCGSASYPI